MAGFVSLVGAGPWDPELLTLAGRERLARADVVIADYLANPALLMHCRPDAEVIQRARGPHEGTVLAQAEVDALMVARAQAGAHVVRLKGGDPFVFGRGGEELQVLRAAGLPYEVVPGVSAPIAAPEMAGIPITHRDFTPAVSFVSGWEAYAKDGLAVQWEHLARSAGTLVLLMGVRNARENAAKLVEAGRPATEPAAVIRWGTRGVQQTVVATLGTIADAIEQAGIRAPAVLVVGPVVGLREQLRWFEDRPLFGRRVVVTRPDRDGGGLVHKLAADGADAVAFPCLDVAPPLQPERVAQAVADLARGGVHDGVIVSSPRGALALHQGLLAAGLDARALAGHTVAAVGTGTAAALLERGVRADVVPAAARAEGLVTALAQRQLLAARWLHLRADEGRDLLRPAIEQAGGRYTLEIAYRTVRPQVPGLLLDQLLPRDEGGEGMDAVCFASGKAARHFVETVDEGLGKGTAQRLLAAARVITIGPVTTAAVEALGVAVHGEAASADDAGLHAATVRALTASGGT